MGGVTILCYPAVNTYIIITGYFMYQMHKNISSIIKSLSTLWLSVVFFSVIGYLGVVIFCGKKFILLELVKRFFPIIRGEYWFYTVYFVLVLLSPFLNKMIDSIIKKEHKVLIIIFLMAFSILPIFVEWKGQLGSNYGYSLIWFIALYITGAYISKYIIFENKRKASLFGFITYIIASAITYIGPYIAKFVGINITFSMYNCVTVYIQAIGLFIMFSNINIKKFLRKPIAFISSMALASYLFHVQEDIGSVLWRTINPAALANSPKLIIIWFAMVICLFILAVALEWLRRSVVKVLKIEDGFSKLVIRLFDRVEKKL